MYSGKDVKVRQDIKAIVVVGKARVSCSYLTVSRFLVALPLIKL